MAVHRALHQRSVCGSRGIIVVYHHRGKPQIFRRITRYARFVQVVKIARVILHIVSVYIGITGKALVVYIGKLNDMFIVQRHYDIITAHRVVYFHKSGRCAAYHELLGQVFSEIVQHVVSACIGVILHRITSVIFAVIQFGQVFRLFYLLRRKRRRRIYRIIQVGRAERHSAGIEVVRKVIINRSAYTADKPRIRHKRFYQRVVSFPVHAQIGIDGIVALHHGIAIVIIGKIMCFYKIICIFRQLYGCIDERTGKTYQPVYAELQRIGDLRLCPVGRRHIHVVVIETGDGKINWLRQIVFVDIEVKSFYGIVIGSNALGQMHRCRRYRRDCDCIDVR